MPPGRRARSLSINRLCVRESKINGRSTDHGAALPVPVMTTRQSPSSYRYAPSPATRGPRSERESSAFQDIENARQGIGVDIRVNLHAATAAELDLDRSSGPPAHAWRRRNSRNRRWRLDNCHRNKRNGRRSRDTCFAPPRENDTRRDIVAPRDLRHRCTGNQRLFQNPGLVVVRPASSTFDTKHIRSHRDSP